MDNRTSKLIMRLLNLGPKLHYASLGLGLLNGSHYFNYLLNLIVYQHYPALLRTCKATRQARILLDSGRISSLELCYGGQFVMQLDQPSIELHRGLGPRLRKKV
jgi:hypothetical protein